MADNPPSAKRIRKDSSTKDGRGGSIQNISMEDNLELFQKEAILRQLREYQREAARFEAESKLRIEQKEDREEQIGVALSEIQLIYDLVESLFDDLGSLRDTRCFDPLDLLRDLLDSKVDSASFKKQLSTQRSSTLALFNHLRVTLTEVFNIGTELSRLSEHKDRPQKEAKIQMLLNKQMELLKGFKITLNFEDHRASSLEAMKEKVVYLESSLRLDRASLENKNSELEKLREELKSANKHVDRLQMSLKKREKSQPITPEEKEVHVVNISEVKISEELKNVYIKELKEVRDEKAQLQAQLDILKTQLNEAPAELIKNSPIYRDALIQSNHFEQEYKNIAKANEGLKIELDAFKAERHEVWERIANDENTRRNTLESQVKNLMNDLTRLRKQRDALATEIKILRAKDELKLDEKQEMRQTLSNHEVFIRSYRTELHRLRMKLAYFNNDSDAVKFIQEHPDLVLIDDYFHKLSEQEGELSVLRAKLSESSTNSQTHDPFSNGSTVKEVAQLKEELKTYQEQIHQLSNGHPSSRQIIKDKDEKIKALQSQCDLYLKSEAQLAKEIEHLGTAYSELTESQANGVLDLGRKEDQIVLLSNEKIKCERRITILAKENEQINCLVNALKKQTSKLQEHIRKLDEQIKNQSFQMKTMERDINTGVETRGKVEEMLKSTTRSNQELKAQQAIMIGRLTELETLLTERTRSLEEERHNYLRQRDEILLLQDRLNSLGDTKKQAQQKDLSVTVEQYQQLLKCTSCSLRFKSHVLVKCMHVFCKQCIDDRLDTRQRKCPSCNEAFGANDVRQIYL